MFVGYSVSIWPSGSPRSVFVMLWNAFGDVSKDGVKRKLSMIYLSGAFYAARLFVVCFINKSSAP